MTNAGSTTVRLVFDFNVPTMISPPTWHRVAAQLDAAAQKVDIGHSQRGRLTPPQTTHTEQQHQRPVAAGLIRQHVQLCRGQIHVAPRWPFRQLHPAAGFDGSSRSRTASAKDPGQHRVHRGDQRGRNSRRQLRNPRLHVAVPHVDNARGGPAAVRRARATHCRRAGTRYGFICPRWRSSHAGPSSPIGHLAERRRNILAAQLRRPRRWRRTPRRPAWS